VWQVKPMLTFRVDIFELIVAWIASQPLLKFQVGLQGFEGKQVTPKHPNIAMSSWKSDTNCAGTWSRSHLELLHICDPIRTDHAVMSYNMAGFTLITNA
jgi:hypothetical protein